MGDQQKNTQEPDVNQLRKVRREKLADLQANGKDPFQITKFNQTHHSLEVKNLYEAHEAELLKDRQEVDVTGLDEEQAKEAVKKAPAKKPAAKRTTAKKAVEPKMEVHFQFAGKDILAKSVLDQAVEAYKSTHKDVEIKKVELYIVAEEGAAYYVVNGEASDDFKVML